MPRSSQRSEKTSEYEIKPPFGHVVGEADIFITRSRRSGNKSAFPTDYQFYACAVTDLALLYVFYTMSFPGPTFP